MGCCGGGHHHRNQESHHHDDNYKPPGLALVIGSILVLGLIAVYFLR